MADDLTKNEQEWVKLLKEAARYLLADGKTKEGLAVQAAVTMLEDDSPFVPTGRFIRADDLNRETFDLLMEAHVDVSGAQDTEVQLDHNRDTVRVNVNGVCLLRVCQTKSIRHTIIPK